VSENVFDCDDLWSESGYESESGCAAAACLENEIVTGIGILSGICEQETCCCPF
jgi:hypothetical protein